MQDAVPMYILETPERHGHPALDVGVLEDERLVSNDGLEIRVEVLEHQVDVLLDGKHIEQLESVTAGAEPSSR
jgi:hypothetical protein